MRLFNNKKVVDEREQMEMYRIEHFVCWITFWVLFLSILGQLIFMKASFCQVAGEWCVFMVMAFGILIGNLKGGHFDYNSRPGWKYYLIYSVLAAVGAGVVALVNGIMHGYYKDFSTTFLAIGILCLDTFVFTFVILAMAGTFVKYRQKKLALKYDEDEEEE